MVKTYKQAEAIQLRRVATGKRGTAKAVRRWASRLDVSNGNDKSYRRRLDALPHRSIV